MLGWERLMAPRPFWKGYLKLSLVTCPVSMTPATSDSAKIRFHTINRATGNRVESRYVDAVTGKPLAADQEVKGYETGEGQYVVLEDDEIAAVALESTRTIDIEMFVPRDSIGWIWLDRPHYLSPDDKVGEEAFAVIREAMAAADVAGIARLVLYRRERAVILEPRGKGVVLWTLRYGDEVRDTEDYFVAAGKEKPEAGLVRLIKALIDKKTKPWSPDMANDPVEANLKKIIAGKKRRKPARPTAAGNLEPAETGGDNVVSIMDALRRSLDAEKKTGQKKSPRVREHK